MNRVFKTTPYAHWQQVPMANWRWKDFSPQELACKGTGSLLVNEDALDKLQDLRDRVGRPIVVTSAYRSPQHNAAQPGAAQNSMHLQGRAFDVVMANHNPTDFERAASAAGFNGIGHYPASNFMHIDDRPTRARWHGNGGWFPQRPSTATPDFTPPARPKAVEDTVKDLAPVVAPLLPGGAAIAQGDGPMQYAFAVIAVLAFAVAVFWLYRRNRNRGGEAGERNA